MRRAAEAAVAWAADSPLILGGDFNLRPSQTRLFEELAERFGLGAPTGPDAIDHLLVRGSRRSSGRPPGRPRRGRCACEGLRLRLSDHAPVEATFATRNRLTHATAR